MKKKITNKKKTVSNQVNSAVSEAVSSVSVQVVGDAPAMASASVYQTAAQSTGLIFENAVNAQNQQFVLGQTGCTQGVTQVYSMNTIADAINIFQLIENS